MSHTPAQDRTAPQSTHEVTDSGAGGFYADACDYCEECVRRHPGISLLVTFGAGFAIGGLVGHALGEPPRDDTSRATRLGRQALDAMASMLPESWSDRLRS